MIVFPLLSRTGRIRFLNLFYGTEDLVAHAYLWLGTKTCAYSSEYVIAVQVASVGNVVYGYARVHEYAQLIRPFPIFLKYSIIDYLSFSIVDK
jgi:hypothetical protein